MELSRCPSGDPGALSRAMLSSAFYAGFLCIAVGHLILSTFLQLMYYRRRASEPEKWKVQHARTSSLLESETRRWWFPLISLVGIGRRKTGRHPLHGLFATINITTASVVAGTVTHLIVAGKTKVYWEAEAGDSIWRFTKGFMLSMAWQSVLEYYWHRFMHLPIVYARLHKYHHFYKSPEPFDDLMIHPLEAFGYYLQLYSPPFIIPMPVSSFAVYMIVCGLCGVLDHSGVALSVPGLYDTKDHDRHHSRFDVNYAFPFPFMDVLHDTYDGQFLGKRYRDGGRSSRESEKAR